jgi:ribonuclease J
MVNNVALGRDGMLDIPVSAVIDIEDVPKYRPGEVCIICTGSQGEPMSALSLMAAHEHKHVKISSDDVVVISAHAIPGNEISVTRIIDSLHRAGAEVLHGGSSPVHVSGHASQEELKMPSPSSVAGVRARTASTHMIHHRAGREGGVPKDPCGARRDAITPEPAGNGTTLLEVERRAVPAGTSTSTASSATWASGAARPAEPRGGGVRGGDRHRRLRDR